MAASVKTSGTQAATNTTEHTLATVVDAGTYQLVVDLSAMLTGTPADVVTIKVFSKVVSDASAEDLEEVYSFIGGQTKTAWRSVPILSPNEVRFTLRCDFPSGTRLFPWAVYQP